MVICIVTHKVSKGDGQGRVNYEVACEALRQGYKLTIISSQLDEQLQHDPNIEWIKIKVDGFPGDLFRNLKFSWSSSKWLKNHHHEVDLIKTNGAITDFGSDVNAVHFVHSAWLIYSRNLSQKLRGWFDFQFLYQRLYTQLNSYWEKKAFLQAKRIVAVSHQVQQELLDIGVPKGKIVVILNGVDLQEFCPGVVDRDEWGLPKNKVIALFAGDIKSSRKNLESVLYALQQIPSLNIAVLGSTNGSPYPKLASELGIAERTHFLGFRKDISKIMKAVDFFVFPSRYEACSLVILEALASGLPVITAKSAGGSEIVTPGCGIVLHNPDDIKGLTDANEIGTNDSLRSNMRQSARIVAEQYSWSIMAKSYLNLIKEMTKE
ncbi:MAG: glycosyl transferase [Leptolyngbya sp.]|nr:MAG: glycosyl transferase [Leptolyngbya sp.]